MEYCTKIAQCPNQLYWVTDKTASLFFWCFLRAQTKKPPSPRFKNKTKQQTNKKNPHLPRVFGFLDRSAPLLTRVFKHQMTRHRVAGAHPGADSVQWLWKQLRREAGLLCKHEVLSYNSQHPCDKNLSIATHLWPQRCEVRSSLGSKACRREEVQIFRFSKRLHLQRRTRLE